MPEPPAEPRVAPPDSAPTIGSPAATAPPPGRQGGVSLAAVVVGGVVLVLVAGAAIWFALNRPPAQPVAPATPATPVAVVPVGSMPIPVSPVQPVTARLVTGRPAVPTMVTPGSEVCRAEWTFDQDSGTTAIDVTSNGYNATLTGHAAWTHDAKSGSGALSLPGNSYAETAGPVVNTTRSFTVAAWVKLDAIDKKHCQTVVSIDGSEVSGFYLQLNHLAEERFIFNFLDRDDRGATGVKAKAKAPATTNTWYHLAGVFDADAQTISLYVDGQLQETVPFNNAWLATGRTAIGRGYYGHSNADFVFGTIDDVRIYASALAEPQIRKLATP